MNSDTMISTLEANGRMEMPIPMYNELQDIDRRIKYGDESGWRGDPTMGVFFNQVKKRFEVWGLDGRGNEYEAASSDTLSTNLIVKLREGDWQRHDVHQRVLDANAKLASDRQAADSEARREVGEKLQWAIRRDFATHLGGRGGVHSISRKVGG